MTPQIRHKAATLLIELESLRECKTEDNSIGTYSLLAEVLKDATHLATLASTIEKPVINPVQALNDRCKAARAACASAMINSKRASAKSANAMERSRKLKAKYFVNCA